MRKWQGAIARCRKVQCERVARCEVIVLHLAKFGNGRVQCSGVAPCDIFLIILGKSGGKLGPDWVLPQPFARAVRSARKARS